MAKDFKISLGQVQRQFDRFEDTGIIISKLQGRTRVYKFNLKNGAIVKPFKELIKIIYDSIPLKEKEEIFSTRRAGKPVIGKSSK